MYSQSSSSNSFGMMVHIIIGSHSCFWIILNLFSYLDSVWNFKFFSAAAFLTLNPDRTSCTASFITSGDTLACTVAVLFLRGMVWTVKQREKIIIEGNGVVPVFLMQNNETSHCSSCGTMRRLNVPHPLVSHCSFLTLHEKIIQYNSQPQKFDSKQGTIYCFI